MYLDSERQRQERKRGREREGGRESLVNTQLVK